jgi:Flp pilus assembly protein TadD
MNTVSAVAKAESTGELNLTDEFTQGVKHLKNGYPKKAIIHFRRAFECENHNPYYLSFLGLSLAYAERKWREAAEMCQLAVQLRRKEMQFHLNLADVYSAEGRREKAKETLDVALQIFGNDERLMRARSFVEKRRANVLPFLGRNHFLNRELGKLRHRALKHWSKEKS